MKAQHLIITALLFTALSAQSADIAREVRSPSAGSDAFLELGIVLGTGKLPLVGFNGQDLEDSADTVNYLNLGLLGRFEYRNFFAEFIENSFNNATLGASVWTGENSELEIVFNSLFDKISRDEYTGMETIKDRHADFNGGVRGSYFFGDGIVQFELVHDIVNSHNGLIGSLQFGHQAQARNWNLHALLGVRYFSQDVIDHLFSVSADEATAELPEYQARDGFLPTVQVGAALPISERWVFRSLAEYSRLPKTVSDSPLSQGDELYSVQAGVYYVFGGR